MSLKQHARQSGEEQLKRTRLVVNRARTANVGSGRGYVGAHRRALTVEIRGGLVSIASSRLTIGQLIGPAHLRAEACLKEAMPTAEWTASTRWQVDGVKLPREPKDCVWE